MRRQIIFDQGSTKSRLAILCCSSPSKLMCWSVSIMTAEPWCFKYPESKEYFCFKSNNASKSRIDFWLISALTMHCFRLLSASSSSIRSLLFSALWWQLQKQGLPQIQFKPHLIVKHVVMITNF